MSSNEFPKIQETSRLLQLPREVRDLIYRHVLVRDVIPIEAAVIKIPESVSHRSPRFCRNLEEMLPSKYSWSHRRLWSIPILDINCDFGPGDHPEDPRSTRSVHMSYQLATSSGVNTNDPIEIRLLQVCEQVYAEAKDIFYCQNVFSFTADFRIPTAFTFLCDRPADSLRLVSSLELALMEDNNMRGTALAHYPLGRRCTDSLVLQYAYNHFTDLCTLMSTSRMQLRNLHLTVVTLAPRYDDSPVSFQDCISWEASKTKHENPWIASWIDPLLRIEGLECIETHWFFDRPRIRRMADTLSLMENHMLRSGGGKVQTSDRKTLSPSGNEGLRIHVLHRDRNGDNIYPRQDENQVFLPEDIVWKEYALAADGVWKCFHSDNNIFPASERSSKHPHVQEFINDFSNIYVCYCRLS